MRKLVGLGLAILLLLVAPAASAAGPGNDWPGAVYTMTNAASGNEVLVFPRAADGALGEPLAYATGGDGTGGGLGNQGALTLTPGNRWLLVVNAGSDTVSVFAVRHDGLTLVDTEDSGGQLPISVTVDKNLVYVLNAGGTVGGADNVAALWLGPHGQLTPISGSSRPLSATSTAPAQVGFDPSGQVLVITEKATNMVDTYVIGRDGLATTATPRTTASPGDTPFGFDFGKRSQLFVSEAGGASGLGSASSYLVHSDGSLEVISSAVSTTENAACWLLVGNDGRHAYTANTPSMSVSDYGIAPDGTLTLLEAQAGLPGGPPVDMAVSNDGRNLYTLNSGNGTIGIFRVHADGSLSSSYPSVAVVSGVNGLAAR